MIEMFIADWKSALRSKRNLQTHHDVAAGIVGEITKPAQIVAIRFVRDILRAEVEAQRLAAEFKLRAEINIKQRIAGRRIGIIRIMKSGMRLLYPLISARALALKCRSVTSRLKLRSLCKFKSPISNCAVP